MQLTELTSSRANTAVAVHFVLLHHHHHSRQLPDVPPFDSDHSELVVSRSQLQLLQASTFLLAEQS